MHQMRKGDPGKYTDGDQHGVLKKSWPKASSTEHKRNTGRIEMHYTYMTGEASDKKVRLRQVHRQR